MNYELMKEVVISYIILILIVWVVNVGSIWGIFVIKFILFFKNEIEIEEGERGEGWESGVERLRNNVIYEDFF